MNDILGSVDREQYQIMDILGQGTFGQVVKCLNLKSKDLVAVKVIKNKPAYYNQSLVEVAILDMLNNQHDPHDKHHIARMKDTFVHKAHLCITFEMLSLNLYELIKQSRFTGFSTNLVRVFMSQILDSLTVLARARIIHCDLKPENILLKRYLLRMGLIRCSLNDPNIKVIDFGSACHEGQTLYTYIQSRFYRSPEVLLGLPYSSSIDMWSVGCIAAELFLGLPLFPGSSEYNQISRIVETLGVPPTYMIEKGKNSRDFFNRTSSSTDPVSGRVYSTYGLKSMQDYMKEQKATEAPSKRYLQGVKLEEVVMKHEGAKKNSSAGLSPEKNDEDRKMRIIFIDFLYGLLRLNPLERWSPQQAKLHPFITGKPWLGPYKPAVGPVMHVDRMGNVGGDFGGRIPETKINGAVGGHYVPSQSMQQQQPKQPLVLAVPLLQGGGAVRTSRQRANTLSSSKVATVPPTLQRLMQHAGGTGGTRGLKHRDKFATATASLVEGSGRSSSGSDRTSPLPPGKREGDDDVEIHNSKRVELSPRGPASAGSGFTFAKNGTMPIPQLKIPKQNSAAASQFGFAHSPTAAMMNSPINRHFHQNAYPQTPSDLSESTDKPKLFIRPYGGIEAGPSSARPIMESVSQPYSPYDGAAQNSAQSHYQYPTQVYNPSVQPYVTGRGRGNSFTGMGASSPLAPSFAPSSLPHAMRMGAGDVPAEMDIDVVNADGTRWGINTTGLVSTPTKMEASPNVLTVEQQEKFQSWKERGPPSSSPSTSGSSGVNRPWVNDSMFCVGLIW